MGELDLNPAVDKLSEVKSVRPSISKAPPSPELSPEKVSFWRDVLPYYLPCMTFVAQHVIYWFLNGNLMWPLFLAYAVNFPYFKWSAKIVP